MSNSDNRQGTRQSDRGFPKTDTTFSVEERSLLDWLNYLQQFAGYIQFIDHLEAPATQTWQGALPSQDKITELVQTLESSGVLSEHLQTYTTRPDFSLLLSFLKLLTYPRNQFSNITPAHHQYYLRNVLRMSPRDVQPDTAHVVFTLAESATSLTLDAGLSFDGGSDASGNALTYDLNSTRTFNQAQLANAFTVAKIPGTISTQTKLLKTSLLDADQGIAWPESGSLSFGEAEITDTMRQDVCSTGLIVASNLLWLSGGQRIISITFDASFETSLTNQGLNTNQLPDYFDIYISTADAEVQVNDVVTSLTSPYAGIQITLDALFSAIAPLLTPISESLTLPFVRFEVKTDSQGEMLNWSQLSALVFNQVNLSVDVDGLLPAAIRNDSSILDIQAPFESFGSSPTIGSRFIFTHPEIASKSLNQLKLNVEWLDKPSAWSTYYAPYQTYLEAENGGDYSAWPNPKVKLNNLYHDSNAQEFLDADNETISFNISTNTFYPNALSLTPISNLTDSDNPLQWPFWFALELDGDSLGHGLYTQVSEYFSIQYTQAVINQVSGNNTASESTTLETAFFVEDPTWTSVPLPYTPQAKTLTLGYGANFTISVASEDNNSDHQLLHNHPAGLQSASQSSTASSYYMLPKLSSDGYLYLGFSQFYQPSELSVLFGIESIDNTNVSNDTQVRWRYLSTSGWQIFSTDRQSTTGNTGIILVDDTRELLESGVMTFSIPENAQASTGFPGSNKLWMQCDISRLSTNSSPRYSNLLGTYAQGATVTLSGGPYDATHYTQPLPAQSIVGPVNEIIDLAQTLQPFASNKSVPSETDDAFSVRAAERIRHKYRAWSLWDYEHIVLSEFPTILWARCYRDSAYSLIVDIVPKISDETVLKPKSPLYLNDEIQSFLSKLAPPYAKITIRSPTYEEIELDVIVSIVSGYDPGVVLQDLNSVINRTLSPWTTQISTHEGLSPTIHLTEVTAVIESQDYIDVVVSISAKTRLENGDWVTQSSKHIQASTEQAILVPAQSHQLRTLEQASVVYDGISIMEIEFDFTVG